MVERANNGLRYFLGYVRVIIVIFILLCPNNCCM